MVVNNDVVGETSIKIYVYVQFGTDTVLNELCTETGAHANVNVVAAGSDF